MGLLDSILDRQLTAILPGNANWPPYSRSASHVFWNNWRAKSPLMTRGGLVGGSLLIFLYCLLVGITRRGCNTLEKQIEAALGSDSYAVRQAATLLKLIASLAYFSDPNMQQLGRSKEMK